MAFFCFVLGVSLIWVLAKPTTGKRSTYSAPGLVTEEKTAVDSALKRSNTHSADVAKHRSSKAEAASQAIRDNTFLAQLKTPYGFSIDPFHNRLVWTSSEESTFKLANIDGSNIRTIASNFEQPYLLKIDNAYGHTSFLYIEGRLIQSEVDTQSGSTSESVLLNLGERKIHGLGFDETTNTLFLGDQYGQPSGVMLVASDASMTMKNTRLITSTTAEDYHEDTIPK